MHEHERLLLAMNTTLQLCEYLAEPTLDAALRSYRDRVAQFGVYDFGERSARKFGMTAAQLLQWEDATVRLLSLWPVGGPQSILESAR